ncbi:MAG TPA: class I SAM-dependent methyltransferase [Solirubrobacterales bacterium]|nr:class I SAM-dependent methyltransferase [Solirubrobacterales bacterium]
MTVERFITLSPELHDYLVAHSSFRDGSVQEVEQAARDMGELEEMQIGGDQAALITVLVRAIGARRALEVGTFLGYGAISIARGLPEDGKLICCELSEEYAERAHQHLTNAGLADRAEIKVGPALDTLRGLGDDGAYDFAFIDADKPGYPAYYEECLRLLRPNGLIMLDNTLREGTVIEPPEGDEGTAVIAELNDRIAADDRVDVAMLGFADGITLARKK